jgi:dihydroflavonol-4-reductase
LVDPAVNGTVGVLEICAATPTVKKVVITASMAAVTDDYALDHPYTEADWNETSSLTRNPYFYSKVRAERAAYEFVEQRKGDIHFQLCTINPSIVLG